VDNTPRFNIIHRSLISQKQPGNSILRDFYDKNQVHIQENANYEPQTFIDLHRLYSKQMSSNYEMQNVFIGGFGARYNDFSNDDLVNFCSTLAYVGLPQEDIFQTVLQSL
jgi:hypothetical protein